MAKHCFARRPYKPISFTSDVIAMTRIAIVENNPSLLEYFTVNLQQADYEVMPLPEGEALDAWLVRCKAGLL